MASLPSSPLMVSMPAEPRITSAPAVPVIVPEPTMVTVLPWQGGAHPASTTVEFSGVETPPTAKSLALSSVSSPHAPLTAAVGTAAENTPPLPSQAIGVAKDWIATASTTPDSPAMSPDTATGLVVSASTTTGARNASTRMPGATWSGVVDDGAAAGAPLAVSMRKWAY